MARLDYPQNLNNLLVPNERKKNKMYFFLEYCQSVNRFIREIISNFLSMILNL